MLERHFFFSYWPSCWCICKGLLTAIHDFEADYAGLVRLMQFRPQVFKLDRELLRNIDSGSIRPVIASGVTLVCERPGIEIIATHKERSRFSVSRRH